MSMRKLIFLALVSMISYAYAAVTEAQSSPGSVGIGIARPDYYNQYSCNVSPSFISSIKSSLMNELNLSDYSYYNLSSSYCSDYGYGKNININLIFKKNATEFYGKQVSASFYLTDVFDYSLVFTDKERNALDYTIQQKYISYVINGTDEEFYVNLNPNWGDDNKVLCENLKALLDTLNGEKYYNEDNGYCSVVIKTKSSEVKGLVSDAISYVYYYGDKVYFHFSGYSEGNYNLASLASSLNCDLSNNDYNYPELASTCYGIYKDKERLYFGADKDGMYLSVYGFIGGKTKISINYNGDVSNTTIESLQAFVNEITQKYFNKIYNLTIEEGLYGGYTGEIIVTGLETNLDAFLELTAYDNLMDRSYNGDGVYATISKPYIQLYFPETNNQAAADKISAIRPYYWNRYLVITKDRVYSEVTLNENDEGLAVSKIKELIDPYVSTGNWMLNMSVTGGYYPIILYDYGLKGGVMESASTTSVAESNTRLSISGNVTGLTDNFASQYPGLSELEEPKTTDLWSAIVNFFKGLFNIK